MELSSLDHLIVDDSFEASNSSMLELDSKDAVMAELAASSLSAKPKKKKKSSSKQSRNRVDDEELEQQQNHQLYGDGVEPANSFANSTSVEDLVNDVIKGYEVADSQPVHQHNHNHHHHHQLNLLLSPPPTAAPLAAAAEKQKKRKSKKRKSDDDVVPDSQDVEFVLSPPSTVVEHQQQQEALPKPKRKKKDRQTSQEEESAQALLALNKGLAKAAENEEVIMEDEEPEEDIHPIVEAASSPKKKKKRSKKERRAAEDAAAAGGLSGIVVDDHHHTELMVPVNEDVEMASAAMAAASAALNLNQSTALYQEPQQRIMSEHLAAHIAKDTSIQRSQQQTLSEVEHRLAVQLQQNGYAAPSLDGNGFISTNLDVAPQQQQQQIHHPQTEVRAPTATTTKKRKYQQQQMNSGHGIMVDPALMQLDEPSFPLESNPTTSKKQKRANNTNNYQSASNDIQESVRNNNASSDPKPAQTWGSAVAGNGDPNGGTFTLEERHAVDNALNYYCKSNEMTMDQVRDRVWGNNRRKDEFWDTICAAVPSRSRASVYKHVRRTCHIFQQRAKWSPEEDEELAALVAEKGNKWKDIGIAMGRMGEDCRDRYRNYVKCGKDRGTDRWTKDEEELLIATVALHKDDARSTFIAEGKPLPMPDEEDAVLINWTTVSDMMKNRRSRIQCRYKWKKMIVQQQKKNKAPTAGVVYEGGRKKKVQFDIKLMLPGDKIWILQRIQDSGAYKEGDIPWESISRGDIDPEGNPGVWSAKDLKNAYKLIRADKPWRRMPLQVLVEELLAEHSHYPPDVQERRFVPTEEQREAATAASHAATAAAKSASSARNAANSAAAAAEMDFTAPVASMGSNASSSSAAAAAATAADTQREGNGMAGVLDPVLMAGGALDQLEKTTYNAALEATAAVARRAVEAQKQMGRAAQQQQHQQHQQIQQQQQGGHVESLEEKELRRQLGGFVAGENEAVNQGSSGVDA